jgi:hypothetical protein
VLHASSVLISFHYNVEMPPGYYFADIPRSVHFNSGDPSYFQAQQIPINLLLQIISYVRHHWSILGWAAGANKLA